ncbi:MAG: InlB B-repeat-containing protein [Clostridia bacterium]|nr:InlB B-repeat-containing protein [Clostridia bacterium]
MKRTLKKSLSIILAALMLVCSVPLAGLAGIDIGELFKASAAKITSYDVGDIIEFGWYPQSKVTDTSIITALNSADGEWKSYNYYSGNNSLTDGQVSAGDFMRYKDIIYGSEKYRAVTFDYFRPSYTYYSKSISGLDTEQMHNGYDIGKIYWFKYEPIEWRVLDPNTGMVMAETILDSQPFNNFIIKYETDEYGFNAYWSDSSKTYYANNYAESSIREWLNEDFYNTVFSAAQKRIIDYTVIENTEHHPSYSEYASETTCDKIYLLSLADSRNADYGFDSTTGYAHSRSAEGSDYAKCQGLATFYSNFVGKPHTSMYWLRTCSSRSNLAGSVDEDGSTNSGENVSGNYVGVRPVLNIKPSSEIFQSDVMDTGNSVGGPIEAVYYAVTWNANGGAWNDGDARKSFKVAAGDEIASPSNPQKYGYTFVGWTPAVPDEMPSKNLTFVAEWKLNCNHSYISSITTPTTCTENGVMTYTCTECGDVYTEAIPTTGHTAGAWETTVEPTTETEGKKVKKCTVCSEILEEAAIAKLPKEPVKDNAVVKTPSTSTISYGDAIILHVDESRIPAGGRVEWTASNGNFEWTANGATCEISPEKSGDTTFTATIYDADGNPVSVDEQTMTSKAGFFQKIIAFFKGLFGLNKIIPNVFKF